MKITLCLFGVVLLLLTVVSPVLADVTSYFTYGDEDWDVGSTSGGTYNPYWDPGGYIYTPDPDGQTTYWIAPDKFRHDIDWSYNGTFRFQEYVIPGQGATQLDPMGAALVGIQGANGVWLSYFSNVVPTSIHNFVISMKAGSSYGWRKGTNSTDPWATYDDMMGVLGNVSNIYIKAEYYAGAETNFLDNVILPEPCSVMALACGLAGLFAARRRKR